MQKTWVWSLSWEDPLEKGTATHSSILALENSTDCIIHSSWGHSGHWSGRRHYCWEGRNVETFLVKGLYHGGTLYLIRSQTFPQYLSNQKNMHKGRKRIKDIGGFICTAEPLSLFGLLKSIQGELNIPFRGCSKRTEQNPPAGRWEWQEIDTLALGTDRKSVV